jgi:hypothetical protein
MRHVSPKCRFSQEPHSIAPQKTTFLIFTHFASLFICIMIFGDDGILHVIFLTFYGFHCWCVSLYVTSLPRKFRAFASNLRRDRHLTLSWQKPWYCIEIYITSTLIPVHHTQISFINLYDVYLHIYFITYDLTFEMQVDSEGLWQWCIADLLGFWILSIVWNSTYSKTRRFGNWICFRPQSRGRRHTHLPLETVTMKHWT